MALPLKGALSMVLAGALALVTGCAGKKGSKSEVAPTCAQGPNGCKCQNTPFTLEEGWAPVAACDALPTSDATWACNYDLNSAGQTTSCTCAPTGCTATGTSCLCGLDVDPADPMAVASCPPSSGPALVCCARTDGSCTCDERSQCPDNAVPVDSCSASDLVFSAATMTATSCDGLDWEAPPPPSLGSGSGSGSGASTAQSDPCFGGCGGCSYCASYGCVYCAVGDLGVCGCP